MNHLHERNTPDEDQQRSSDDPRDTDPIPPIIRRKIESGFYDRKEIEADLVRKLIQSWRKAE